MNSLKNLLFKEGFLYFFAIFNFIFFLLWNYVMDDAFITFKYAQNFVEHFKPYYNVNSDFQGDGQTSFLWFLILTIPFILKISPIFFYSVVNYYLSMFLLYAFAKNPFTISKRSWINICFKYLGGTLFSVLLAVNSKHGLETVLYISILVLLLKNWNTQSNSGTLYSILLFLTRPEGIVFSGIYALSLWKNKKLFWRNGFTIAGALALFIAYKAYFFDELVPLPFIFKSSVILDVDDVKYFILFAVLFFPVIFHSIKNKQYFYAFPLVFFLIYYSFGMERIMGFGYRFSVPLMAYWLIPMSSVNESVSEKKYFKIAELAYAGTFLLIIVSFFRGLYSDRSSLIDYGTNMDKAHIAIGKFFSDNPKTKIFISDAGAIAFYSKADCYDTYGLNDALFLKYRVEGNWEAYFDRMDQINGDYLVLMSGNTGIYTPAVEFENELYKHYQLTEKDLYMERRFGNMYHVQVYSLKRFKK